jgi:hypothetical protein
MIAALDSVEAREEARATLRTLRILCDTHDPVTLAAYVTDIPSTLASAARIDLWIKKYRAALRERQPQ